MSAIFGGSKQKSQSTQQSGNSAYPYTQQAFAPMVDTGNQASSFLSRLLGLGGSSEADEALQQYKDSTGYKTTMDSGVQAISQAGLTSGSFNSGRTLKRLTQFGQDTSQKYLDGFLAKLFGLTENGLNAGRTIAGAGQYSTGQSTSSGSSNNGMGNFLGSIIGGAAASDPRLKTNIEHLGVQNGLNVYRYNYIWDADTKHVGYMADEVARSHPEALGPKIDDEYLTLYYDKLPAIEGV